MTDLREEILDALEDKPKCIVCGKRKNVVRHNPFKDSKIIGYNFCSRCHTKEHKKDGN
jgi:hypothetical protein